MSTFKIITGSSNQVSKLVFTDDTEAVGCDKDRITDHIQKDLIRLRFLSQSLSIKQFQDRLVTEFFADNKLNNTYTQGDFDSGFLKLFEAKSYMRTSTYVSANDDCQIDSLFKSICVCYVNDANQLCGFSIQITQDIDNPIPKVFHYSVAITTKITDLPENREITLICDTKHLNDDILAQDIASSDVLDTIKKELKSAVLYEAVAAIISNHDVASEAAFDNLYKVIETGHQDSKIGKNCYNELEQLNQHQHDYFRRRRAMILIITAAVIIGAASILALIYAPPVVVIIAAVALGVAVIAGGGASLKYWKNETSLKTYEAERDVAIDAATSTDNKQVASAVKITTPPSTEGTHFTPPIGVGHSTTPPTSGIMNKP